MAKPALFLSLLLITSAAHAADDFNERAARAAKVSGSKGCRW